MVGNVQVAAPAAYPGPANAVFGDASNRAKYITCWNQSQVATDHAEFSFDGTADAVKLFGGQSYTFVVQGAFQMWVKGINNAPCQVIAEG